MPGETLSRHQSWRRVPGWLRRYAELDGLLTDSEDVRPRKSVLVLPFVLQRGIFEIKGKGHLSTYLLIRQGEQPATPDSRR